MSSHQQDLWSFFASQTRLGNTPQQAKLAPASTHHIEGVGEVLLQHSWKARNYRLTLRRDGKPVITIPLKGNQKEALNFAERHRDWLDRARQRQQSKPRSAAIWLLGTKVLWRGNMEEIRKACDGISPLDGGEGKPSVCLAADVFRVPSLSTDLRPTMEAHFARKAKIELSGRAWELAAQTGLGVKQVTIRNQRSRWGSCSSGGVISLNWRLIQTPDFVRDYVIYHELAHLLEMNHSNRFWNQVERFCPDWQSAEAWLKQNGGLMGL
jgi:predicted metal-dependent hydrolase